MPVVNPHDQKYANFLCECVEHTLARRKGVEANRVSVEMLEAFKAGDQKRVDELIAQLEQLNQEVRELRGE